MTRELDGISVVICTYKGDEVLPACLEAIRNQTWTGKLEVIVVNDDPSSELELDEHPSISYRVLNNRTNLGPAGARNLGIQHAKFNLIAFTDDDCRPEPKWLSELVEAIQSNDSAVAAGGKTLPQSTSSTLLRYLAYNNPMQPLELNLSQKRTNLSRFSSYLRGLVQLNSESIIDRKRTVYALPSANLAVRMETLRNLGMFDQNIRFSGEDQDLCRRLNLEYAEGLIYNPKAVVYHQYKNSLRDTLRRSKVYAVGNFVLKLKWPEIGLIVFPIPVVWAVTSIAILGLATNYFWLPTVLLPFCYPRYLFISAKSRSLEPLIYFAINFLQDCWENFGFIQANFTKSVQFAGKLLKAKNSK
jgi:GT2 family glycosyltransferase